MALQAEVWPRPGLVWVAGTDAYSDSGSLEFCEHWELVKEVRGLSLFPLHSLRLVPESQLSCSALFWRGCRKWGWGLLQVLGSPGSACAVRQRPPSRSVFTTPPVAARCRQPCWPWGVRGPPPDASFLEDALWFQPHFQVLSFLLSHRSYVGIYCSWFPLSPSLGIC